MDVKCWICLSEFFYSSLSCPSLSHNSHHLPVHQAFSQQSIYSSFYLSTSVTAYIYFRMDTFSVDFCVGNCLDTCLPFLNHISLFFKHLKIGSNISLWDFFFLSFFFCLNRDACIFETDFLCEKRALSVVLSLQF